MTVLTQTPTESQCVIIEALPGSNENIVHVFVEVEFEKASESSEIMQHCGKSCPTRFS